MRGHYAEHDLRSLERLGETRGYIHVRGNWKAGKIDVVFTGGAHALGHILFVDPKPDAAEARREHDGERRAPASGPDDGQPIQRLRPLSENTFSEPARKRSIFSRWR